MAGIHTCRIKIEMKTIAIDFDGVIHKYSKGWHDGTCYDEPMEGAEAFLRDIMKNPNYNVFIFSTRNPRQIQKWLIEKMPLSFGPMAADCLHGYPGWDVQIIPFWVKFWNKKDVLGITKRKLPAIAYIDDRAVRFDGDWKKIINEIIKS